MEDDWTPIQFDKAVSYFGMYIENKMAQRDADGKPLYSLTQLIGDEKEVKAEGLANLIAMFGVIEAD